MIEIDEGIISEINLPPIISSVEDVVVRKRIGPKVDIGRVSGFAAENKHFLVSERK